MEWRPFRNLHINWLDVFNLWKILGTTHNKKYPPQSIESKGNTGKPEMAQPFLTFSFLMILINWNFPLPFELSCSVVLTLLLLICTRPPTHRKLHGWPFMSGPVISPPDPPRWPSNVITRKKLCFVQLEHFRAHPDHSSLQDFWTLPRLPFITM